MTGFGPPRTNRSWAALVVIAAVLGASLTSVLIVGGAHSANPSLGLIAFARYDGIYVMRSDGSGVHALRRGGVAAGVRELAWSPDGRKLAFTTQHSVWVMNADGTRLVRVVKAKRTLSPTWSPNGGRIAFTRLTRTSAEEFDRDIWTIHPDGSGLSQLTDLPDLFEYDVDWSPIAGRIAFATGGYVGSVFELSLDGTPLEDGSLLRLLTQPRNYAYQPEWSPDGRRIVFTRRAEWETVQLFLVKVGTGDVRTLTKASAPPASDAAWSADGRKVVFVRGDVRAVDAARKRSEGEIYVINADGTGLTRLTHNHLAEGSPAWQPVGPP